MSSAFSKLTTPRPFKLQRSELPVARAATGGILPVLTNLEIQNILDQEETGTLADFFAASPLWESGLEIERSQDGPRDQVLALAAHDGCQEDGGLST